MDQITSHFRQYSRYEDGLIKKFSTHPFLLQNWDKPVLLKFLLQLGHLSTYFVGWYERAKQGFESEELKEAVRKILRDEIPSNGPTHQDNRLHDLELLGLSRKRILNNHTTRATQSVLQRLRDLVAYPQPYYDLRVLVILRIAGEILVGETYRHVVPALETQFGLRREKSLFYFPHFLHDVKGGHGHSDSFDELLKRLITDERAVRMAKKAAEEAFQVRYDFLNQFPK